MVSTRLLLLVALTEQRRRQRGALALPDGRAHQLERLRALIVVGHVLQHVGRRRLAARMQRQAAAQQPTEGSLRRGYRRVQPPSERRVCMCACARIMQSAAD